MIRTKVQKDYSIRLPKALQSSVKVGDELLIAVDQAGRITLIPAGRAVEILRRTAGLWQGRADLPADGVEYVNQLRPARRLAEQQEAADEDR